MRNKSRPFGFAKQTAYYMLCKSARFSARSELSIIDNVSQKYGFLSENHFTSKTVSLFSFQSFGTIKPLFQSYTAVNRSEQYAYRRPKQPQKQNSALAKEEKRKRKPRKQR